MHTKISGLSLQVLFLGMYKILLDFVFLKAYYDIYAYMIGGSYEWEPVKYLISMISLAFFLFLTYVCYSGDNSIQKIIITFFMVICIIPMLSVYAFLSYVKTSSIIYPVLFWILMLLCITRKDWLARRTRRIAIPSVKQASMGLLIICAFWGLLCWVWAGFPVLLSLSDSTATRIALRVNRMPTLLGYVFVILGGVIFPYLFARYLDASKRVLAIISMGIGFLLYSINGMKTWLFLYAFIVGMYFLCGSRKGDVQKMCNSIVLVICALLVVCVASYILGGVDLLSQFGRVFCIPSSIGFKSINFFGQADNPYLFLRESILRSFFESPYPGGSDFYMNHGSEITINSGRANNGLWGDAYRNFGIIGILIYPFFISRCLASVARSVNHKSLRFQIIIVFLAIWNAVNLSFFTWLITGGVIALLIFNDFFASEDLKEKQT